MLEKLKKGDTVVFKNGEEARISNYAYRDSRQWRLWFNIEVAGWLSGEMSFSWIYLPDGKRDTEAFDGNDIVKIVRS